MSEEADALAMAYRACLDETFDQPPTETQKRLVMADLRRTCFVDQAEYTGNEPNEMVFHRLGRRSVVMQIFAQIQRDPYNRRQPKGKR